jgi:hypothetical protein
MNFSKNKLNEIQDLENGFFLTVLDFPTSKLLKHFIDKSYKYVWVIKHFIHDPRPMKNRGGNPWFDISVPVFANGEAVSVKVKNMGVSFDFIVSTEQFSALLEEDDFHKTAGIRCIQMNNLPPDYFNLDKFKGNDLFKELKKMDMNFFADFPGTDYGRFYSTRRIGIERMLENPAIDLANLP